MYTESKFNKIHFFGIYCKITYGSLNVMNRESCHGYIIYV